MGLENTRLRTFADRCAKLRNDISHFGGERRGGASYNDFLLELHEHGEALGALYHVLLLHEIGIDEKILKRTVFDAWGSFGIKVHFAKVGLLDKSAVEPKPPTAPAAENALVDAASASAS